MVSLSRRSLFLSVGVLGLVGACGPVTPAAAGDLSGVKQVFKHAFMGSQPLAYALYRHPRSGRKMLVSGGIGYINQVQFFDLATGARQRSVTLGDEQVSGEGVKMLHYVPAAGAVLAIFGAHLFKISVVDYSVRRLGNVARTPTSTAFGSTLCSDGLVRFGSYPDATVTSVDVVKEVVTYHSASAAPASRYIRHVAETRSHFVGSSGSVKPALLVWRNKNLNAAPEVIYPPHIAATGFLDAVQGITDEKVYLAYPRQDGGHARGIYDLATGSFVPMDQNAFSHYVGFNRATGQAYMVWDGYLWALNLATGGRQQVMKLPRPYTNLLLFDVWGTGATQELTVISFGQGTRWYNVYDLATKTMSREINLVHEPSSFLNQSLRIFDGNPLLYVGSHQGTGATAINVDTGHKSVSPQQVTGQVESYALDSAGRLFFAAYPNAVIYSSEASLTGPRASASLKRFQQLRPVALAGAANTLVVGSAADYGIQGGALSGVSRDLKILWSVAPVPNQSVIGLTAEGNTVYGGTSIVGGMGIRPATSSAHVFKFDVASQTLLWATQVQGEESLSDPVLVEGRVYVAGKNGIYGFDAATGKYLSSWFVFKRGYEGRLYNASMGYSVAHRSFVWVSVTAAQAYVIPLGGGTSTKISDAAFRVTVQPSTGRVFIADNRTTIVEHDISAAAGVNAIRRYGLRGAIGDYYNRTGGEAVFGAPLASETPIAGGMYQQFSKNRHIYWHPAIGTNDVYTAGGIGATYLDQGGPARFGFPTNRETPTSTGFYQSFKTPAGHQYTILWERSSGRVGVVYENGAIGGLWSRLGREWGALGYPIGSETGVGGGVYQRFSRGYSVYWTPKAGAHVVVDGGAIAGLWARNGGPSGRWGLPVTGEYWVDAQVRQRFESGVVAAWDSRTGGVRVV